MIFVYDVTDRDTFEHIKIWLRDVEAFRGNAIDYLLVGNKCDAPPKTRVVEQDEGAEFAKEKKMPFLETSAATALNVETAFENLAKRICFKMGSTSPPQSPTSPVPLKRETSPPCCK